MPEWVEDGNNSTAITMGVKMGPNDRQDATQFRIAFAQVSKSLIYLVAMAVH
jgi:hypothetical protein